MLIPLLVFAVNQLNKSMISELAIRRSEFGGAMPTAPHLGEFPVLIYYPEGKHSERFVLFTPRRSRDASNESQIQSLRFERKLNGKVVDEWVEPLDSFARVDPLTFNNISTGKPIPLPRSTRSKGSFLSLLWRSGYKPHRKLSSTEKSRLTLQEGFAGYAVLSPVSSNLSYWYIDRNSDFCGMQTTPAGWRTYPITSDEKRDLVSERSQKNVK